MTKRLAVGSFRGDGAWLNKSFRQTSLIVEPVDGRMPPLTPEAERRRAPRDQGTFGVGPFDTVEDFTLYDRCITRGVVGSILPVIYGNGNRILQTPGQVVISYEMVHDTRSFRSTAARTPARTSASTWAIRAAAGKATR